MNKKNVFKHLEIQVLFCGAQPAGQRQSVGMRELKRIFMHAINIATRKKD